MAHDKPPTPAILTLLGIARLGVGLSCWILPRQACKMFALMALPSSSNIVMRLFGARDAALAILLLTSTTVPDKRRLVTVGALVDIVDILACFVGWFGGEMEKYSAMFFAAEAGSLVLLAALGLRFLQYEEYEAL